MKEALVLFLKYPQLGKVKTRLAKGIGTAKALELYQHLVHRTLQVAAKGNWNVQLYWAQALETYPGFEGYEYHLQQGDDLGSRMAGSIRSALVKHDRVVLIGSDIPNIHEDIIQQAFDVLQKKDLVFGPAKDGGYYLVGARKDHPELFTLPAWSHADVLKESLAIATSSGLTHGLVSTLSDLDTVEDLQYLPELQKLAGMD